MTRLSRKLSLPIVAIVCAIVHNAQSATYAEPKSEEKIRRIAAVVTAYYHNSHADVIVSRLLEGDTLNNKGEFPKLKLVSQHSASVPSPTTREN